MREQEIISQHSDLLSSLTGIQVILVKRQRLVRGRIPPFYLRDMSCLRLAGQTGAGSSLGLSAVMEWGAVLAVRNVKQ